MIKVKICGITNHEDALFATINGADAIGFVFYKNSPRYIEKDLVKDICKTIPPFISSVGVFVNEDPDTINSTAEYCGLDIVQLHGDEPLEDCAKIQKKIIKAIRVRDKDSMKKIINYRLYQILLDTYVPDEYGGSGKTFDWDIIGDIKHETRVILSGGLNCDNILAAINQTKPYAVDVSSGVELAKGKKDNSKVKRFIQLVKSSNW